MNTLRHANATFRMAATLLVLAIVPWMTSCERKTPSAAVAPPVKIVSTVSKARLERLRLGINLSHWHWLPHPETPAAERDALISSAELEALARAGATHVRLPIQPADYWDDATAALREDSLAALRASVDKVLAANLAVIVDAHPTQSEWKSLDPQSKRMQRLEAFWNALAKELATTDPERVFMEPLNEPFDIPDAAEWSNAQARLVEVIRTHAPNHTLILTGDQWGGVDGLLRLTPVADANVIYTFHTYEPTIFTHQGATWGFEPWQHMRGVPYPLDRKAVQPLIDSAASKAVANSLKWDSRQPWDAEALRKHVGRAAAWGEKYGVPIYCGEFGVYGKFAGREHRLAWLRDMTVALDHCGMGRAVWDYSSSFGVVTGEAGARTLDADVAKAIGLRPLP